MNGVPCPPAPSVIEALTRIEVKLTDALSKQADHEARMRELERKLERTSLDPLVKDITLISEDVATLTRKIEEIRRWRSKVIGVLLGASAASGGLGSIVAQQLF